MPLNRAALAVAAAALAADASLMALGQTAALLATWTAAPSAVVVDLVVVDATPAVAVDAGAALRAVQRCSVNGLRLVLSLETAHVLIEVDMQIHSVRPRLVPSYSSHGTAGWEKRKGREPRALRHEAGPPLHRA